MGFEIADVALGIEPLARPSGVAGPLERGAQRYAVATLRGVDLVAGQRVDERATAQHVAVMALLVGPGNRLDPEPRQRIVAAQGPRRFQRIDDAERAVEPAAMRLGLAVRADQQASVGAWVAADHVADAVDDGVE